MSLEELSARQSDIPTPYAKYGVVVRQPEIQRAQIRDESLPRFLARYNADPALYRQVLTDNWIGSVFDGGLQPGMEMVIPQTVDAFSTHPEA